MMPFAVHTKKVSEALGLSAGLEAVAASGAHGVVLWTGEDGRFLDQGGKTARCLGLDVLGAAGGKLMSLGPSSRSQLRDLVLRSREEGITQLAIVLGPQVSNRPPSAVAALLGEAFADTGVMPLIENSGSRAEPGSNLSYVHALVTCLNDQSQEARLVVDLGHLAAAGHEVGLGMTPSTTLAWVDVHDNDGRSDHHRPLGEGTIGSKLTAVLPTFPTSLPIVLETDHDAGLDSDRWMKGLASDAAFLTALDARRAG